MSFIRDKANGLIGVLGVLRDVSERKQAESERARLEERLRESDRMRQIGQLAGGVAHDFNNQLAGIRGSAEVLLRKDAISGSLELSELTQGIVQAADRSAQLTRQMLAFARKTNVRMEPIDLHELAAETVSMLERSIDKRIGVHLSAPDPSPITLGDAAQIHSALLNIALNARDAMPDGGTMEIAIVRTQLDRARGQDLGFDIEPAEYIAVSTRDTGVGLNEETRARMFEPFYTTKEKGRGTGMGLAVVDGTVRAHGGAIEVVSTPGQGTTVTLYFRAAAEGSAARPARTPSEPVSAGGTAMVVDDEDAARKATAALLGLLGYAGGHVLERPRGDRSVPAPPCGYRRDRARRRHGQSQRPRGAEGDARRAPGRPGRARVGLQRDQRSRHPSRRRLLAEALFARRSGGRAGHRATSASPRGVIDRGAMQYREYGKTGKLVSVLSAGGMRYEKPDDIDRSAEVMVEAARLGVNYFDTAPGYSSDKSEDILGAAVREMKRLGLPHYVSTKTWAPDHDLVLRHVGLVAQADRGGPDRFHARVGHQHVGDLRGANAQGRFFGAA